MVNNYSIIIFNLPPEFINIIKIYNLDLVKAELKGEEDFREKIRIIFSTQLIQLSRCEK